MEKKGHRAVQASSKGPGTDKKNLDGANGKPWPRGGRRREPSCGGFSTKNENFRKPVPQRNKSIDKRPRARGNYSPGAVGGNEGAGLEELQDAELGSVFVPGSKKQSLNHLLNFHYATHETKSGKLSKVQAGHRWMSTGKHKYNKEQFLQANCQFIVKATGNYKQYSNNPDALVDWNLIEQVNVQVSEFPSCPICLYQPMAAKMTRCGHIYCWSCMLHYLALSDKSSRKCPICDEAVHKEHLKSVIAVPHTSFKLNDKITFKLMKRLRGSLVAYPANECIQEERSSFNVSDNSAATVYCKLLLANACDVIDIIERERRELKNQLQEDENAPEKCFIEQALILLIARESVLVNEACATAQNIKVAKPENDAVISDVQEDNCTKLEKFRLISHSTNREHLESMSSDDVDQNFNTSVTSEDLDISHLPNGNRAPTKIFYFYQASDGQHLYLHALNVRMLEHTYGSLENCPHSLCGRIMEKEGGSMTEEIRKRLRYLQHLPVTCQFEVAEIHLNETVVSKDTLLLFHDQIETRRKRRQRRAREEKRREKRIAEEENRMMGKYPEADIHLNSPYQFPEFCSDGFKVELECGGRSVSPESGYSLQNAECSSSTSGSVEQEYSGVSFAKMLSTATSTKRQTSWPQLATDQSPSQKLINVTGSTSKPVLRKKNASDSEPENEDYVPVPAYNRSFSDAIALALEKASQSGEANKSDKKQGKKKKNKQKVLFATSMSYGAN